MYRTIIIISHPSYLTGGNQHMIVSKIANPCITNVTCENGITATFWMKYSEGDLIFATGGFHGKLMLL